MSHTYKLCPDCSYFCSIKEPDEYCSYCGSQLISKCPNCNNEIVNPYASFCKYCGTEYPGRNKEKSKKRII